MKFEIKYLPIAQQDLTEIVEYIQLDNPGAALSLIEQFDESISKLADFPQMGVIPKDIRLHSMDYRMLVVHNYIVFYVIIDKTIEIRRILYGKRKYSFLL